MLGFGPGSPIYYDMEAYPAARGGQVLRFLTAWTRELHTLRYTSGVYSNSLSGISDLASNYANPSYAMPDIIYDALWNGAANTRDPAVPATDWARAPAYSPVPGRAERQLMAATRSISTRITSTCSSSAMPGGSAQASPASARATGAVDAFFRGADGQLWHDSFTPGAGWQRPVSMGGSLATRPSAVTSMPGTVAVFAKGTDGRLWAAVSRPGTGWSALRALRMGQLGSRPAAVAQADGVIDVFWRGSTDDHLWHARYTPGTRLGQAAGPGRAAELRAGPRGVRPRHADRVLEGPGRAALGYPAQARLPLGASG